MTSHPQVVLEDDDEDDAPYDAAESMPPAWDQWDDWVDPTAEQEAPPACAPTAPMAAARAPSAVLAPPSLATFPRAPWRAPLPPSPSRPAQLHVDQKGLLPSPNAARTTPQARIAHLSGDLSWIESLHDGSGMTSLGGTWMSTAILIPVGIFLTYKAMNDSQLFNNESYFRTYRTFAEKLQRWRAARR